MLALLGAIASLAITCSLVFLAVLLISVVVLVTLGLMAGLTARRWPAPATGAS